MRYSEFYYICGMKTLEKVSEMISFRSSDFFLNKKVGFVPTMGALHQGHLALVKEAKRNSDICVVSIFVNPRQFNNPSDFKLYPKHPDRDIELLKTNGCDVLFLPESDDIYSNYDGYDVDLEGIDNVLEGKYRPGHFKGVIDVVYRLFDIVRPHKSFFGQKDYQQLVIIKKMTDIAMPDIEIVECPTVREKSGLAMSSRNQRLTEEQKESASQIYKIINEYELHQIVNKETDEIANQIKSRIDKIEDLKTEYVAFCEQNTLKPVIILRKNMSVVLCVAVFCGQVRLIDNKILHF